MTNPSRNQAERETAPAGPKSWSFTDGSFHALLAAAVQTRAYLAPQGEIAKRHAALNELCSQYRDDRFPAGFTICEKTMKTTIARQLADYHRTDSPPTPRCEEVERLLDQVDAIAQENRFEQQKKTDETAQKKRERDQVEMLHDLTKGKATRGLDPEVCNQKRAKARKLPDTPADGAALFLPSGLLDKLEDLEEADKRAEEQERVALEEDAKTKAEFLHDMRVARQEEAKTQADFMNDMRVAREEDAKRQAAFMNDMTAAVNNMMTGMMAIQREQALSIKDVLTTIKDKN